MLKIGDKVRVTLEEGTVTHLYQAQDCSQRVNTIHPNGTQTYAVPRSMCEEVVTPEVGDIWEQSGEKWVIAQRQAGIKAVILETHYIPVRSFSVAEFMLLIPAPVLKYRSNA